MSQVLTDPALDQLFRTARTYNAFSGEISDATLHQLYDLLKFGPTEANTTPARIVFVKSKEAKARLEPALSEGNHVKTMAAPCVAIVGFDMRFFDKLPVLFPHTDAKSWFDQRSDENLAWVAMRSSSLQTAYLILAARALGLDCGPMSGFDNAKVQAPAAHQFHHRGDGRRQPQRCRGWHPLQAGSGPHQRDRQLEPFWLLASQCQFRRGRRQRGV